MPKISAWLQPILHMHPTRRMKTIRQRLAITRFSDSLLRKEGPLVKRLLPRNSLELARVHQLETNIEQARPRGPPYAREGNLADYKRAVREWTKYLRSLLENPKLRRRLFGYLTSSYLSVGAGTQITFAYRHGDTDQRLHQLLLQLKQHPTSFLDVGAAFESYNYEGLPDDLAPLQESKQFFDEKGIRMKYTAADIVPISREKQHQFRGQGITALTWDYRERPLYQTRGQVRQFSIIRMANVSRHQTRTEFRKTVQVLLQSLEPNGLLIIKNSGDGLTDEAFYQKKRVQGNWILVKTSPQ